jgi:hypothetical protein
MDTKNPSTGAFEEGDIMRLPADLYHAMIRRITGGLFYSIRGIPLPADTAISVERWRHFDALKQFMYYATIRHFDNQFSYALFSAEDHPFDTLWLYALHEQEYASAATGILAKEDEE